MFLLFQFLVLFSFEITYFVPVLILFILREYSLHIYYFSRFFSKISLSSFTLYPSLINS